MTRTLARSFLALSLLATACAHAQKPGVTSPVAGNDNPPVAPDRTIRFAPIVITSSKADADMSTMNDEELFAIGQNAMAAGDNKKALQHFERLADYHQESKHRPAALHFAGLMLERMKDYTGALGRFKGGDDGLWQDYGRRGSAVQGRRRVLLPR